MVVSPGPGLGFTWSMVRVGLSGLTSSLRASVKPFVKILKKEKGLFHDATLIRFELRCLSRQVEKAANYSRGGMS